MRGVAVLRSVLRRASPYLFVPFRSRLFLTLHVFFGSVWFVSVCTLLVLAGVLVWSPPLSFFNSLIPFYLIN